mgnify:CR=1 FL=1
MKQRNGRNWALSVTLALSVLALGCEREGPAERAGERVDRGVEKAGDSVERAGERSRDRVNR